MATHKSELRYGISFDVNKQELELLKKEFTNLANVYQQQAKSQGMTPALKESIKFAQQLGDILNKSWNSKLGQLNLNKVNTEIKNTYKSVDALREKANQLGATNAFNKFASAILNTNTQLKQSNKLLNEMALTFKNTIRFGISSSVFNNVTNSIRDAFNYSVKLDKSLNDIRIVTTKSADDMERFAQQANKAAKALGNSTRDYTEASLIYYQQGLNDKETAARTETTLKTANVTGQSTKEVSEQLTAVWNGYKVNAQEAEAYVDKLAAVAATTAADLEELSTGMSKVASAANVMGVDIDQLNAQLATIVSVTRQAPESVGTALKTIYARISDIKSGLSDETTLGNYTKQMAQMGINVLDANNNLRDMGDVIEEIGGKWNTLSREQQVALSQTMAGTRQYNNLLSLFDNWDMYTKSLQTSTTAAGTLQRQQDIYMESTTAHLQKIRTEAERTYDILFDTKTVNGMADAVTGLLSVFNEFLTGLGGGINDFIFFGATIANIFKNQIGGEINRQFENLEAKRANANIDTLKSDIARQYNQQGENVSADSIRVGEEARIAQEILNIKQNISEEEYNQLTALQQRMGLAKETVAYAEGYKEAVEEAGYQEKVSLEFLQRKQKRSQEDEKILRGNIADLEEMNYQLAAASKEAKEMGEVFDDDLGEGFANALGNLGIQDGMTDFENLVSLIADNTEDSSEAYKIIDGYVAQLNEKLREQLDTTNKINDAIERKKTLESPEYQEAKGTLTSGNQIIDDTKERAQQRENINTLVSGFTSLIALGTALSGIIKTITDDSLTAGDKIKRVLTTVVGMLPMVIMNFSSIAKFGSAFNSVILPKLVVGLGGMTAAEVTAGASATAMWTALLGPAAIVVAAIAAVAGGIWLMNEALSADSKAAERAHKAVNELKDSNEDLMNSYNELQETWTAYQTAKEKLDSLTTGTKEWREELQEVNATALELIGNLKGLSSENIKDLYSRDSKTGEIIIDPDVMQETLKQQEKLLNTSNLAVAGGETYATRAQNKSDILSTTRQMNHADNFWGRFILDSIFSSVNPLGITSLFMREGQSQADKEKINEHLDEFNNITFEEFKNKMQELGISLEGMSETEMKNFKDSLDKMAKDADAASEKLKLISQIQTDSILGDNYDSTTKKLVSNQVSTRTEDLMDDYKKQFDKNLMKASGSGNKYYQELVKKLQAAGYDYDIAQGQRAVKGTDNNRSFTFLDENGEEVERSWEWVAQVLASKDALGELEGNAKKVSQALSKLDENTSKEVSKGLKGYLENENFESLTESEFKQLQKAVGKNPAKYLSSQTGLSDKELQSLLGKDYAKDMQTALDGYATALKTYTKKFATSVKDSIKELEKTDYFKELTVTQQKQIAKTLEDARKATPLDKTLMDNIFSTFKKVGKNSELDEFATVLSGITDWSNVSVSELSQKLKEAGVSTSFTNKELQSFIDNMIKAGNATKDFSSLSAQYAEIHKIIDNLKRGSTISAEDYAKLGSSAKEYFTKMLDGTYKLTGDAEKFYNTIQNKMIDDFSKSLDNQREKIQNIQNTSQYDYNALSKSQVTFPTSPDEILKNGATGSFSTGINKEGVQQQLDFINAFGNNDKVSNWSDQLSEGTLSAKDLTQIAEAVRECKGAYDDLNTTLKVASATLLENEVALLSSASSLEEMKTLAEENETSTEAFTQAWLNLNAAQREEGLDANEISDYAKYIRDIADETTDFADVLGESYEKGSKEAEKAEDVSKDLATQILRMNKGVEDLAKNWDDWSDVLKRSSKGSDEYRKALKSTQEALSDLLDISSEYFDDDWIADHMDDIAKAADGDADAIDRLREASLESILISIDFKDENAKNQFINTIQGLQDIANAASVEIAPGMDLTDINNGAQAYLDALNQMIMAGQITASDVNAALSAIGYSPVYEEETVEVPYSQTVTTTHHQVIKKGSKSIKQGKDKVTVEEWDDRAWTETEHIGDSDTYGVFGLGSKEHPPTITGHKISGMTKKAGGSANNFSSRNSGGGSPSGRSGGGGGSGGGSAKEPKHVDPLKEQADRYHQINAQIEKIDNSLKKLQSLQSKYLGTKLLENLTKQWDQLNTQIENYNAKLRIAHQEQNELRSSLAAKGVQFNADGTIANYTAAFNAQQNSVNSLINQYNSLSASAQESWDNNKTIDKAKENFNEFKKNLDRYDELVTSFIPDLEQKVYDAFDQQIEINIKKFNMEIELTLDMNKATREWNEWKKKAIDGIKDEDILGQSTARFQDFSTFFNDENTGDIQAATKHLKETIDEYNALDTKPLSVFGDDRAKALENLKEQLKNLEDAMTGFIELEEELYQNLLDEMDHVQDKFDEQVENYEYLRDIIEHDVKVIQLLYGDDAYGELEKFYNAQQQNYLQQLDFQRQQKDFWYEQIQLTEKGTKEWESAVEKWKDSTEAFNEALENSLENAREGFENTINKIFKNLNMAVTKGLGLDYVNEQWDLIVKKSDQYLDNINAAAGIQSLEKKYIDAINKSTRVQDQRKITALMEEELNALKTKDKLTQYDLDRAEKKYNLMVAQIALEDAQRNKNQMRLRRDSQGNYTYQYVTDESAIQEAQEALSNVYTELYNFDKAKYKENLEQIYQLWDEYQKKMAEAALINDPELRAQRELLIQEEYGELINGIVEENQDIRANLQESTFLALSNLYEDDLMHFTDLTEQEREVLLDQVGGGLSQLLELYGINAEEFKNMTIEEQNALIENMGDAFHKLTGFYNEDIAAFRNMSDTERSILTEQIVPYWDSALQHMAESFYGPGGFESQTIDAWNEIKFAEEEYADAVEMLNQITGNTFDTILMGLDADLEKTRELIEVNDDLVNKYAEELEKVSALYSEFIKLKDARQAELAAAKEAAAWAEAKRKAEEEAARRAAEEAAKSKNSTSGASVATNGGGSNGGGGSSGGGGGGGGNGVPEVGEWVTYNGGGYSADSYGGGAWGYRGPGKRAQITIIKNGNPRPIHLQSSDSAYGWVTRDQISGYDTGGYTGSWNNSGKLALLHQKELVLNAQDTENMLNTVAIMRSLAYSLGSNMLARLAGASAIGYNGSSSSDALEQNVHIDAQFPNVRDAAEIEKALNNLVNAAAQRAFENK